MLQKKTWEPEIKKQNGRLSESEMVDQEIKSANKGSCSNVTIVM